MAGLRRVLVVGCGGSGVSTLCFTMDYLKSELHSRGVKEIPPAWQFVAIDVPVSPQDGPLGLPDVRKLGATYVGTGTTGGYGQVDRAVTARASASNVLSEIGTWMPREDGWGVTVSDGAGQYRAVGRMLALSKLDGVRSALQLAWNRMGSTETHDRSAQALSGLGEYDRAASPLVLVVSSMAGGAGASMALDVCRTLAGIPGVDPTLIAVFMVNSEVFKHLPASARTGVFANSLGMLGEIVASQNGAAAAPDARLWKGLGLGEPSAMPFGRVFPVGRTAGTDRALFGDGSPMTIYRSMGRALGGLMSSASALEKFIQFDLTNRPQTPTNLDLCGWGGDSPDAVVWGSLGFASLSMGRDRYAEYAAQRLARGAVDRLRSGHVREDEAKRPSTEQLKDLLQSQWPLVLARLNIWDGSGKLTEWVIDTAWPRAGFDRSVKDSLSAHLTRALPSAEAQDAAAWATTVRRRVADQSAELRRASDEAARQWAFTYTLALHQRILEMVADATTRHGLPFARELVQSLSNHFRTIAPRLRELETQHSGKSPERLDPTAEAALSGIAKVLRNGQALLDAVEESVRKAVGERRRGQFSGLLAGALEETCGAVLAPLEATISEQLRDLEHSVKDATASAGLAQVATDQYVEWPAENDVRVKARFDEATNEVLLTTSSDFSERFTAHVEACTPDGLPYPAAREEILGLVISGEWPVTGGGKAPGRLVEELVPAQLRTFLAMLPQADQVARVGQYRLHVRPTELLDRARAFIERPGEPFAVFCDESLRSYAQADNQPEYERTRRHEEIRRGFRKALDLALPLATPNAEVVSQLHAREVTYRFKYSEVPFRGTEMVQLLSDELQQVEHLDQETGQGTLNDALSDSELTRRIDVFGSYPNYAFLCFDSVLNPAIQEWNRLAGFEATEFWKGRRARPLPGSLPFTDVERKAMVAGWVLGQITGHVRVRLAGRVLASAEVFDSVSGVWQGFPEKLLASAEWLIKHPQDSLPAVLEASLAAAAAVSETRSLAPLAPYRTLRRLYDDGASPLPPELVRGGDLLEAWVAGTDVPGGSSAALSRFPALDRKEAALMLLMEFRKGVQEEGAPITRAEEARNLSLRRDLHSDLLGAVALIEALIEDRTESAPTGII